MSTEKGKERSMTKSKGGKIQEANSGIGSQCSYCTRRLVLISNKQLLLFFIKTTKQITIKREWE